MRSVLGVFAFALVVGACGDPGAAAPNSTGPAPATAPPTTAGPPVGLETEAVAHGLSMPVGAVSPPDDDRLFVVEKTGTVREVIDGEPAATPYLDVTRFVSSEGLEQGLLGLAFHPGFAENGRAFVSFTNVDGDTRILEYREDPNDPSRLDATTGRRILAVDQPHEYHNGGMVEFGPDGMLWIGLGDGGAIGDPWGHGQNPHTRYGSLLRIDVDGASPYAIPADNPFADGIDGAAEVWAYGLRNPWRFTFSDDLLFVADVGQEAWEEIIVLDLTADAGSNHGWSVMEGPDCFEAETCDTEDLLVPDLAIPHVRTCAVIGGPVYEGAAIPALQGHLLYADFCVGWVKSIRWDGSSFVDEYDWSDDLGELGQITSLAKDADGEPLVVTAEGDLYRIVPRW